MVLPTGQISFSDLRRVIGPNDTNSISLGQCRPSYPPAYGNGLTGVTDTNIAMSQFKRKSKILKSGLSFRAFKGSAYTFTLGAGGAGGAATPYYYPYGFDIYSYGGGGGGGGILVNGGGGDATAGGYNSGYQTSGGGGGTGYGAGGGCGALASAPAYGSKELIWPGSGNGSRGFAYLALNNSEFFTDTNTIYNCSNSGTLQFIIVGAGANGPRHPPGTYSVPKSTITNGGDSGSLNYGSIAVTSGTSITITIGYYGASTSIVVNGTTYTAAGGDGGIAKGGVPGTLGTNGSPGTAGGNAGTGTQSLSYLNTARTSITIIGGYFADNPTILNTWTEQYIGSATNMTTINTATGGIVPANGSWNNYSVEWFGYFYATVTGTYTFYTKSSDASFVWVGNSALSGYTTSNCIVDNRGIHVATDKSGTISLIADTFYPIRCQFGGNVSSDSFSLSFSAPGIDRIYNMDGYVYYSLGGLAAFPAESARIIKALSPSTNTDGIYYINVNGTSTATYCLMDNKWDGGGWMMLMKATRGYTFNFDSTYWTDTSTTLNTGNTNRNDGDAKFNVMNYGMVKDVLALWPDATNTIDPIVKQTGGSISQTDSWSWMVPNYYAGGTRCTVITGFSTDNSRDSPSYPDPLTFPGFSNAIWSTQLQSRRHIFGGGSHLASASYPTVNSRFRWGFIYNENALDIDFTSSDVGSGIGMKIPFAPAGLDPLTQPAGTLMNYSAGDAKTCCQFNLGVNRSMRVELYGR